MSSFMVTFVNCGHLIPVVSYQTNYSLWDLCQELSDRPDYSPFLPFGPTRRALIRRRQLYTESLP